ncbi:MAG: ethylbenzene dehydrogenase-related protein [Acidimicrobiia bacterium]
MTNQRHEEGGEQTEEVTHMRTKSRWLVVVFVFALVAAACTGSETEDTTTTEAPATTTTTLGTTTTEAPPTTEAPATTTTEAPAEDEDLGRSLDAPIAAITVDGDTSDWALVPGLATTLEPIEAEMGEPIEDKDITVKMAYDDENIYALVTVEDDYNWNADDAKLSAAFAMLFPVDTGGPHMGADDEEGEVSTGLVDIWHWETECAAGVESGGAVNPPGDGKDPGNDSVCNFDDEWATDAETREDDNGEGAENSLFGVWTHSNPVADGAGVWYFEMSRPLQTGDAQDAQFTPGDSTLLAIAYWDPDFGPDGWEDDTHVQSANQEWIEVNLVTTTAEEAAMERSLDAPEAAITVDGDTSDWALIPGLATTLEPIVEEMGDGLENMDVTIRMAHDDENIYALFTIDDDYNWNADDAKLSAAVALLFPVDTGGPHMGTDDDLGETSTGLVDIWHWETECAAGVESGGAVNPPGDGKDPGNDSVCNFDDEWASDAETREDDNLEGAENSLFGVWSHSNPVDDGPGVYYFEMSRPLQTGDAGDAQFTVGEPTVLALAYWDVDLGPDGWHDDSHVQSANQEWIVVNVG